jgi:NAD(P)H-dependent FMN reductase
MAPRPLLEIIICSTRPGRKGPALATWVEGVARAHGGFDVELVGLKEVDLPLLDEPNHPMLSTYEHDHTKRWSETIKRADALIFVMPEYNHSFNAALKNAIDYLHHEWANKPVGLVSYGGVAAGTRAVQTIKPTMQALSMIVVPSSINISGFTAFLNDDEVFEAAPGLDGATEAMLDAMLRWTETLAPLRG